VSGDRQSERAQLWSIYFGLLSVVDPPPFLARTRDQLKQHLEGGVPPSSSTGAGRAGYLRLVR
jgi:hypothetical protein